MNVVRTYMSAWELAPLWVIVAKSQGEFRWVGWCFSQLGWKGWFKSEWVSAKPNGFLVDINRSRNPSWNNHSLFFFFQKTLSSRYLGLNAQSHQLCNWSNTLISRLLSKRVFLLRKAKALYRAGIRLMKPYLLHLLNQDWEQDKALHVHYQSAVIAILLDISDDNVLMAIVISFIEIHF